LQLLFLALMALAAVGAGVRSSQRHGLFQR
jgi:hypothetical protein